MAKLKTAPDKSNTYRDLLKALRLHYPEDEACRLCMEYAQSDLAIYGRMRWFKPSGQLAAAQDCIAKKGKVA